MGGLPGVGCLIIDKEMVKKLSMKPLLFGSQQYGLRGGTENMGLITAGVTALLSSIKYRDRKNVMMFNRINYLLELLAEKLSIIQYEDYYKSGIEPGKKYVVLLGPNRKTYKPNFNKLFSQTSDKSKSGNSTSKKQSKDSDIQKTKLEHTLTDELESIISDSKIDVRPRILPNTLLMGFIGDYTNDLTTIESKNKRSFCNVKLKKNLEEFGNIIVSIGSACNTQSKFASHVIDALRVNEELRKGIIRVSISDYTTDDDIITFARVLLALL